MHPAFLRIILQQRNRDVFSFVYNAAFADEAPLVNATECFYSKTPLSESMKIGELQPRQGRVELEATIVSVQEPRTYQNANGSGKVCNARITDGSGEITLTLWNDDCDKFKAGDKLKISNGYVGEWQGELQLGAGKFGTLEKLS